MMAEAQGKIEAKESRKLRGESNDNATSPEAEGNQDKIHYKRSGRESEFKRAGAPSKGYLGTSASILVM